jgi:hypothetical protein
VAGPPPTSSSATLGTIDSGTDWLPPPVAQTLVGFRQAPCPPAPGPPRRPTGPVPAGNPPRRHPPPGTSPAQQPPSGQGRRRQKPPTPAAVSSPSAGPQPSQPGPEPLGRPGTRRDSPYGKPGGAGVAPLSRSRSLARTARPTRGLPGRPSLFRKEPARKRADAGTRSPVSTRVRWSGARAKPRPAAAAGGPGRVLAPGALWWSLAVAGLAAVALHVHAGISGRPAVRRPPPQPSRGPEAVVKAYFAAINTTQGWRRVCGTWRAENFSHTLTRR